MLGQHEHTVAYQRTLIAALYHGDLLDELEHHEIPGMYCTERGPHHLVLEERRRYRYGPDIAVGLGIAILLAVLIATAITPFLIVLLPLALLPGLPLWLEDRATVAVSAVPEADDFSRVTVHGQLTAGLVEALDKFFDTVPSGGSPRAKAS